MLHTKLKRQTYQLFNSRCAPALEAAGMAGLSRCNFELHQPLQSAFFELINQSLSIPVAQMTASTSSLVPSMKVTVLSL